MPSRTPTRNIIFSGATGNGVGNAPLVDDFKILHLEIAATGYPNFTVKVQGSLRDPSSGPPTFSSAASATNKWDYVAFYDYRDPTTITAGDEGLVFTGQDGECIVRNLLINVEGLSYVTVEISEYVAGTFFANTISYSNQ